MYRDDRLWYLRQTSLSAVELDVCAAKCRPATSRLTLFTDYWWHRTQWRAVKGLDGILLYVVTGAMLLAIHVMMYRNREMAAEYRRRRRSLSLLLHLSHPRQPSHVQSDDIHWLITWYAVERCLKQSVRMGKKKNRNAVAPNAEGVMRGDVGAQDRAPKARAVSTPSFI